MTIKYECQDLAELAVYIEWLADKYKSEVADKEKLRGRRGAWPKTVIAQQRGIAAGLSQAAEVVRNTTLTGKSHDQKEETNQVHLPRPEDGVIPQ